jgi:hypothetical protein
MLNWSNKYRDRCTRLIGPLKVPTFILPSHSSDWPKSLETFLYNRQILLFPITSESIQLKFSHPNYDVILPKRRNKHVTLHSVKTQNTTITAYVGTYPPFWTAYRSHLEGSSSPTAWRLQMGPIRWPETLVNDYQYTRCKPQIEDNRVCNCWLGNDVKKVFWWSISVSNSAVLLPISHCLSPRKWTLNKFSHGGHLVILRSKKNSYTDRQMMQILQSSVHIRHYRNMHQASLVSIQPDWFARWTYWYYRLLEILKKWQYNGLQWHKEFRKKSFQLVKSYEGGYKDA